MTNRVLALAASLLLAGNLLWADASYTKKQTIKSPVNTASPMASMLKQFGGGDMLKALEPTTDVVMIRGNKMVTVTARGSSIMDLDKQAWIQTDAQKHEYYVMTFQQMSDMMERFSKMENAPPPPSRNSAANNPQIEMDTTFDISEEHPGTTKEVAGYTATEHIFKATITTRVKDTSGQNASSSATTVMHYTEEIWVTDKIPPAYQAMLDFQRLAGEKAASLMSPAAKAAMPQGIPNTPGTQNGMVELQRRVAALKGLHLVEVTRVSMSMDLGGGTAMGGQSVGQDVGQDGAQGAAQPAPQQTTPATPAPATAASSGTTQPVPSKLGGLGGALARGALGGFGTKKAATPPPAQTPAPAPAPAATAQNQPAAPNGEEPFLSETTIELGDFSTEPVVSSGFEVPAGYKQVPSPLEAFLKSGK